MCIFSLVMEEINFITIESVHFLAVLEICLSVNFVVCFLLLMQLGHPVLAALILFGF